MSRFSVADITSKDPDVAFRNLDDDVQYKWLLLDSPLAEELFSKNYLDLELDPYETFSMKLIRGRFHEEHEVYEFIADNNMEWMYDNGWMRYGNKPGISPYYWEKPNVLILWPAGFGKTTVVSTRNIPVMEICDNPNSRNQFIGKNETEAFSFSTTIRRELDNPRLVADFGHFHSGDKSIPWSNQAFSVEQREFRDVRENFEFYGTNSHAELGKRSDRVYIDDVETPDTARTPDMRDKLMEWMRIGPFTSARPIWNRDALGHIKIPKSIKWSNTARYWSTAIVGTIFHPEAFYAMVMRDPTFTCIKFDCFKDKKCSISLSDKMLSVKELERERRSIGHLAFNKRYRNIAYNEEEMAFREAWIRGQEEEVNGQRISHKGCLDTERGFTDVDDKWELYAGFDPASGSRSRWSAYAAYVILGYDPTEDNPQIHLVDFLKLQDNFDRMLDHLLEGNSAYNIEGFLSKYQYRVATVEKNAFGRWIVHNDRMKPYVAKGLIKENYTGTNKTDPEAGVFAMGQMIQDGRFRIPYAESSDQERAEEFIGELLMYPKGTCDLVMSMWLCTQNMKLNKNEYRSYATPGSRLKHYNNPSHD